FASQGKQHCSGGHRPKPSKIILAPLPGCGSPVDSRPRVSHKTLHPGLHSVQPFGLATPEACKYISPGYAFFAYPGKRFTARIAPRRWCEEPSSWRALADRVIGVKSV